MTAGDLELKHRRRSLDRPYSCKILVIARSMVMKYRLLILVSWGALTVLTLGGSLTFAHHSASATYIHGKSVKIEGTLREFVWRNPHSFMKVQAPDEKGEMQTWVIEGAAPAEL